MASGNISRRGKASWRLKFEMPRDPATGERRIGYKTIKSTRKAAETALRAIMTAQDQGITIDPTKITVGQYLDDWLTNVAPQAAGPKALERYRGLVRNQIKPYLGTIHLQRFRPADVSAWLQTLIRETGLSTLSIRPAKSNARHFSIEGG